MYSLTRSSCVLRPACGDVLQRAQYDRAVAGRGAAAGNVADNITQCKVDNVQRTAHLSCLRRLQGKRRPLGVLQLMFANPLKGRGDDEENGALERECQCRSERLSAAPGSPAIMLSAWRWSRWFSAINRIVAVMPAKTSP